MKSITALCLVLVLVCYSGTLSECARILGVFPMPAPSHYFLGNKLLRELANRGHEVTMISPFKQKPPMKNYTDIQTRDVLQEAKSKVLKSQNLFDITENDPLTLYMLVSLMGSHISHEMLKDESFVKLLNSNEKFDVIVVDMFFTETLFGLAHRFNCPIIVLSTVGFSFWVNHLTGNPAPWSYTPNPSLQYPAEMTLCQRIKNVAFSLIIEIYNNYYYFPKQNEIMKEIFPDAPDLNEIMYNNISLILMNSHFSISGIKPLVQSMIQIGGYHVDDPKQLPKDIKKFMDNSKEGVILFSMGSNLKSADLPDGKRIAILKAFSKLKQKVLWKFENETLEGKPDNVMIKAWLPQNDIMAHPNLKLFITHGGLLSTTEAVYHGVPLLGIPVMGDQQLNVQAAVSKGFAVRLDFVDVTEETLTSALNTVLNDPKYAENAKTRSKLLHDQPVRPIDSAIFWTEYVVRNKGAEHLKSPALKMHWTQIYLLDVFAVIGLVVLITVVELRMLYKKISNTSKGQKVTKEKKKK